MWIILLMWIALIVYKSEYNRNLYENPFSKQNSIALRGICAIEIMLGHLGIATNSVFLYPNRKAGILIVGIFFALSGYGLMYSVDNKKDYMNNFLLKRIPKIIIPACMAVLIMQILRSIIELDSSGLTLLLENRNIFHMVNWYIWEQAILYFVFFICITFGDIKKTHWFILFFSIIFIAVAFFIKINNPWYGSTLCFWLGIYFYINMDKFIKNITNIYACILVYGILVGVSILSFYALGEENFVGNVIGRNVASFTFVILIILLLCKFKIGNKMSFFLGKYSFEIFVFHQLVIDIMRPYIENDILYSLFVILVTIMLAVLYRNIANRFKNFFLDRNKY